MCGAIRTLPLHTFVACVWKSGPFISCLFPSDLLEVYKSTRHIISSPLFRTKFSSNSAIRSSKDMFNYLMYQAQFKIVRNILKSDEDSFLLFCL
jgi:hypothetical protein